MKTDIQLGLNGAFRVQVYSGKTMTEDTDWFNNFITPTGLFFPTLYPFVDCFRFLSLGNDQSTANYGALLDGKGTTGLASPIPSFGTSDGGTQNATYIGWPGYANGSDGISESACGTILTEQGPRFYRAWTIPTGGVKVQNGSNGLNISEFMVSP